MDKDELNEITQKIAGIDSDFSLEFCIGMMGTSGVGKTVLMIAMLYYLLLRETGLNIDTSHKKELLGNYTRLCSGEILPGTARQQKWEFVVKYGNLKLFNFNWIDYRGGATNNPDDPEFEKFYDYIKSAIAIFVLADADEFMNNPQKIHAELKAFRALLEVSLTRNERPIHLVLILTKSDAIALRRIGFIKWWNKDLLLGVCNEVFAPVFQEFVRKSDNIRCDVIPISAYGKSGIINHRKTIVVKPHTKSLQSFQIDSPLRYVFSSILKSIDLQIPELEADLKALQTLNVGKKEKLNGVIFSKWLSPKRFFSRTCNQEFLDLKNERRDVQYQIKLCEIFINELKQKSKIAKKIIAEIDQDELVGFSY